VDPDILATLRDMPRLTAAGLIVFTAGAVGATYAGFRLNGWRSCVPFVRKLGFRDYFRLARGGELPYWPMWLWFVCTPIGVFLAFAGIIRLAHHH